MEKLQFRINNGNKEIVCDVIATYHDDDTNKDFIVYTDRTLNENHKLKLYYSLYKKIDNNIKLIDIIDIEDKKIGLQLIQEIVKDLNK